jgi:hypothetical protein
MRHSPFALRHTFGPLAVLATLSVGCAAIPVHMHTETHVQHADGTVEHKSSDWEGTLDQLPEQLGKAGKELGEVTSKLAKELTDVPPPGTVHLKDLNPELGKFEGKKGADFLVSAKGHDGKPMKFDYVRLGVPQYDDFFKTAQELHALVYETTQVTSQIRKLSAKALDKKYDAKANLRAAVDKTLELEGKVDGEIISDMKELAQIGQVLAVLIPEIANKIGKLVQTGEALVASAAASITNPKVVAHLDLVKQGIVTSVTVVKESGELIVDFGKDLSGFKG